MNRFPIRREKGRIPLCTGIALLAQNRQGLNCHRMDEHGTPIPPPSDGMHVPKGHRGRPGHSRCPERAFYGMTNFPKAVYFPERYHCELS